MNDTLNGQIELIPLDELDHIRPKKKTGKKKNPTLLLFEWFARHHGVSTYEAYANPKWGRYRGEAKRWTKFYDWQDVRDAVLLYEEESGERANSLYVARFRSPIDGQVYIDKATHIPKPPPLFDKGPLAVWVEKYGERAVRKGVITQEQLKQIRQHLA